MMLRAAKAGPDAAMRLESWDDHDGLRYDRILFSDPASLRFADAATNILILGPSASGKPTSLPPSAIPPFAAIRA